MAGGKADPVKSAEEEGEIADGSRVACAVDIWAKRGWEREGEEPVEDAGERTKKNSSQLISWPTTP